MNRTKETRDATTDAKLQAEAQLEGIIAMVADVEKARALDDDGAIERAEDAIREDPLDVCVRSGWVNPAILEDRMEPEEFYILLCTGGPAVRIIGELDSSARPSRVRLQYQDWGTPWTEYFLTDEKSREAVREYSEYFYYGK